MRFFSKPELPITPALICLLLGNLLDGVITLILLELDIVRELNPILAQAYRRSPLLFMVTKICVVHGSILIAMIVPHRSFKTWFVRSGALLYLAVVGYQFILILAR